MARAGVRVWRWRSRAASHTSDSRTLARMTRVMSAGMIDSAKSHRQDNPATFVTSRKATLASRYPTEYPSCRTPEKKPRRSAGIFSIASAAPSPHADAVEQSQHEQDREVRRERAEEAAQAVEADVDDERCPAPRPVGPDPEDEGADRPHEQGRGREERHLCQRYAEVLGDLGIHEDHEEVVERVHGPAEERGDEGAALVGGQRDPSRSGRGDGHDASLISRSAEEPFMPRSGLGHACRRQRDRRPGDTRPEVLVAVDPLTAGLQDWLARRRGGPDGVLRSAPTG